MKSHTLKFLLVPDSSAARRIRRLIAERRACSGVIVGTWPELISWVRSAYLQSAEPDEWDADLNSELETLASSFWTESYSVAPKETKLAIESALVQVISATDPATDPTALALDALSRRPQRHLNDLLNFYQSLENNLPENLSLVRGIICSDSKPAMHHVQVFHKEGFPQLTRWQTALVNKLNGDAEISDEIGGLDKTLSEILEGVLTSGNTSNEIRALNTLQTQLFSTVEIKQELDDSVQWVGVRDFLLEAEIAVGMVQEFLAKHQDLEPSDIGLMIPEGYEYTFALNDALRLAGMPVSGLPIENTRRDLGREALLYFLYCLERPAPAMALAACLSSPLMPWSMEEGLILAQKVMDGDYRLRSFPAADKKANKMLQLIRNGKNDPAELSLTLKTFVNLLKAQDEFAQDKQCARATLADFEPFLDKDEEVDWSRLRELSQPQVSGKGNTPDFNLEGITIWLESQEPWRPVKRLIVLGFAQGHYPPAPGYDPVFSSDDILAIQECTGLQMCSPVEVLSHQRKRFKRQLGATSKSVTFLIPRRTPDGSKQGPSESMVFMHNLFNVSGSTEELIKELDAIEDRQAIRYLATIEKQAPVPPRELVATNLAFNQDLLAIRTDTDGNQKPESPSSLETLMVSGLAWLLRRLDAEPQLWAREKFDPLLMGSLAHKVFEKLFNPEKGIPERQEIPTLIGDLLDDACQDLAPFLKNAQWQVEYSNFVAETTKAALTWQSVLKSLSAEVLGTEEWIYGTWAGITIHGQSDLVLALPGNRLLVVDYKRSNSDTRRKQMENGYDSQATLYRAMLNTGGLKDNSRHQLNQRIQAAESTDIVYYMLIDQVCLSDASPIDSGAILGWQTIHNDVAGNAMALIQRRVAAAREGKLTLNGKDDEDFIEKQFGLKPYALQNSPLITLFTLPGSSVDTI